MIASILRTWCCQLSRGEDEYKYAGEGARAPFWSAPAELAERSVDGAFESQHTWQAEWIVDPAKANLTDGVLGMVPRGGSGALPATILRKEFRIPQTIRKARAYATALGLYELRINGQRVREQLLAPEWTDYRKRVQVQTYAVTGLLKRDANAIGAWVGEGWYAGCLVAVGRFGRYGLSAPVGTGS